MSASVTSAYPVIYSVASWGRSFTIRAAKISTIQVGEPNVSAKQIDFALPCIAYVNSFGCILGGQDRMSFGSQSSTRCVPTDRVILNQQNDSHRVPYPKQ